ncbi:MAG: periplasmic flagellar collar protein FlcA, partial [Alkalispirochaetaceae bacterium]
MPQIEDIEQFNETLVQTGNEPAILAERGEEIEEVSRPEEGLPGDLSDLLSDEGSLPETDQEPEEPEDLLSRLSEAIEERDEEQQELGDAETPEEEDEEDLFSDIDLGDEEFDIPADFEESFEEETTAPEGPPGEPPPEPGEEDEFDLGEFDFEDEEGLAQELSETELGDELSEAPPEEDEPSEAPPAEEFSEEDEPSEAPPEEDDFSGGELGDLGDLGDLGSVDDLEDEEFDVDADLAALTGEEPGEQESEAEAEEDEFDLSAIDADFVDEEEEEEEDEDEEDFDLPEDSLDEIAAGAESEPEDLADEELPGLAGGEDEGEFGEFDDMEGFGDLEETEGESFDVDEFDLDEFGTEFGVVEEAVAGLDAAQEGGEEEDLEEAEGAGEQAPELSLTEGEFDQFKRTLGILPLNLKLAVEEIIGEAKGSAGQTETLVRALVDGKAPSQIGEIASKILGRRIEIPKGYRKRSGLAFEQEQATFAYQFTHRILPLLRTIALVSLTLGIVGWLAYEFVYQPIYAATLYREGQQDVLEDRYTEGNETFNRAYELWPRDRWFLRYADSFVERRQYQFAEEKYDQLVFGMNPARRAFLQEQARQGNFDDLYEIGNRRRSIYEMINVHREGILAHAALQSEVLAGYERADDLLRILLQDNNTDYEALLSRGDNYMRWAESLEEGEARDERLDEARLSYIRLINRYGTTDELLFRLLRYFIRVDNKPEVDRITEIFQSNPEAEINPQIYAELAGYLIDKEDTGEVRDIIFRALEIDDTVPELHYQLARFYRTLRTPGEELTALENASVFFEAQTPLTTEQRGMFIDTDIRLGEYYYEEEEYITSEDYLVQAQARYERAVEQQLLEPDGMYGR